MLVVNFTLAKALKLNRHYVGSYTYLVIHLPFKVLLCRSHKSMFDYILLPPSHFMWDGLTYMEIKKKVINVVEKWIKWWDLSIFNNRFEIVEGIFNNRFEIVEGSSECNSVYLIKGEYKIER